MSFKTLTSKIIGMGIVMTVVPFTIFQCFLWFEGRKTTQEVTQKINAVTSADFDQIAETAYALCSSQQEVIQQWMNGAMKVARKVCSQDGGVRIDPRQTVEWKAVDQLSLKEQTVSLPAIYIGKNRVEFNDSFERSSPLVDEIRDLQGVTCTLFQRMNRQGDFLRVCTNVRKKDGSRAVGTYLPQTRPDGSINPVVQAILEKKPYQGSAFVVNAWYVTAYEPVLDGAGEVIGMLYVGVPMESAKSLRECLGKLQLGKSGYVFVVNAKGQTRGQYAFSHGGKRDGENVWDVQDGEGHYPIREICAKAIQLAPDQIAEHTYFWKNPGETVPRQKVARIKYFAPWDWVIGVGVYTDELSELSVKTEEAARLVQWVTLGVALVTYTFVIIIWTWFGKRITGRIDRVVVRLKQSSGQITGSSSHVASASQHLAEGSSEQASSLEETSASLEQMSSMTRQSADNANQANIVAREASNLATTGVDSMKRMSEAINRIKSSAAETAKIIKTIDEIAFQTNLLALNAAVEAARAGEAGKGFAVVAEEVRNLARRSAEAAKSTADLIEGSQKHAEAGVAVTAEVARNLGGIKESVGKVADFISEIAAATKEQSQGVEQINAAVMEMDKVVQQNAANAEESSSAAEELSSEAQELEEMVSDLVEVVEGTTTAGSPNEKVKQIN